MQLGICSHHWVSWHLPPDLIPTPPPAACSRSAGEITRFSSMVTGASAAFPQPSQSADLLALWRRVVNCGDRQVRYSSTIPSWGVCEDGGVGFPWLWDRIWVIGTNESRMGREEGQDWGSYLSMVSRRKPQPQKLRGVQRVGRRTRSV